MRVNGVLFDQPPGSLLLYQQEASFSGSKVPENKRIHTVNALA